MSLARPHRSQGPFHSCCRLSYSRNHNTGTRATSANYNNCNDNLQYNKSFDHSRNHDYAQDFSRRFRENSNFDNFVCLDIAPSSKRRKLSDLSWGSGGIPHQQQNTYYNGLLNRANLFHCVPLEYSNAHDSAHSAFNITSAATTATRPVTSSSSKLDRSKYENNADGVEVFVSRDEIERCSPSTRDGIDSLQQTHLRYSYCVFLQNLGFRLDLPQTTIGTAMVLCHRFFFRRSHASHNIFLIATAALFLSAKSEETARPLNDVLKASCEILHKQDFTLLLCLLHIDWFEHYRERIFEAEQLILTTLNFELNVQHPYDSLTSTLEKLGFSQSVLVVLALNLIGEGVYVHSCMIFLAGGRCAVHQMFSFSSEVELAISFGSLFHDDTLRHAQLAIEDSHRCFRTNFSIALSDFCSMECHMLDMSLLVHLVPDGIPIGRVEKLVKAFLSYFCRALSAVLSTTQQLHVVTKFGFLFSILKNIGFFL